jgi:hypothetical protein
MIRSGYYGNSARRYLHPAVNERSLIPYNGSGGLPNATYDLAIIVRGTSRMPRSRSRQPMALLTEASRALRRAVSTTFRVRANRSCS